MLVRDGSLTSWCPDSRANITAPGLKYIFNSDKNSAGYADKIQRLFEHVIINICLLTKLFTL